MPYTPEGISNLSNDKILVELAYLVASGSAVHGCTDLRDSLQELCEKNPTLKQLTEEALKRMKSIGPPKTEKATFGALKKGEEFLTNNGARHRVIMHRANGVHGAVEIEGKFKDEAWYPAQGYDVFKIIK